MLTPEIIERTPWHEFFGFFLKGNPPLIILLLMLNAVFVLLFLARRIKGKRAFMPSTVYAIQALVILANFVVIYHVEIYKYAKMASSYV
jgi:hypothetical protein